MQQICTSIVQAVCSNLGLLWVLVDLDIEITWTSSSCIKSKYFLLDNRTSTLNDHRCVQLLNLTRRHGYYNYTGVFAAAVIARRASRIGCWNVGHIGGIKQCNSMVVLGDLPLNGAVSYTHIQTLIVWILSKKTLGFSIDHVLYIHTLCESSCYQFVMTSLNSHRCAWQELTSTACCVPPSNVGSWNK